MALTLDTYRLAVLEERAADAAERRMGRYVARRRRALLRCLARDADVEVPGQARYRVQVAGQLGADHARMQRVAGHARAAQEVCEL